MTMTGTGELDKDGRLIDRYLADSLSGSERQAFIDRLDSDLAFRDRVLFRRLLVDGIRLAADQTVCREIEEEIDYRKPLVPFGLKILLAFLLVIVSGLLVWNYLGSDRPRRTPIISFKWFSKKSDPLTKSKSRSSSTISFTDTVPSRSEYQEAVVSDTLLNADDSIALMDQEIVVHKDQLQISISVTPKQVGATSRAEKGSLAEETAQKLNPAAGLVEEKATALQVEFWLSPVNYRGYKWNGSTILLYGIEEPDRCVIYQREDRYLLRIGTDLFDVSPCAEFQSYRMVKDPELLQLCP